MNRRLEKELQLLLKEESLPGLKVEFVDEQINKWKVTVNPPLNSVFENDPFYVLNFNFPETYPLEPPHVVFDNLDVMHPPPVHEHVYSNGDICISVLSDDWAPSIGVKGILLSIVSMLSSAVMKKRPPQEQKYLTTANFARNVLWTFHDTKC